MTLSTEPLWNISVTSLGRAVTSHQLQGSPLTFGKALSCQLVVDDPQVSREHCRLWWESGAVQVEDLTSTNGILQNGRRSPTVALRNRQDHFQMGSTLVAVNHVELPGYSLQHEQALKIMKSLHQEFLLSLPSEALKKTENIPTSLQNFLDQQIARLPLWINPAAVYQRLLDEIVGFGPLQGLMSDLSVSEIMVNGSQAVFVVRAGKLETAEARFFDEASLRECVQRLIAPVGRHLDEHSPMVDARLPNLARLNAVIPPLSLHGTCLTLRKINNRVISWEALLKSGAISPAALNLLQLAVERHCNIVIAGGTDTGKTTLLWLLAQFIHPQERLITLEDTAELNLGLPHLVALEARPANAEGAGAVGIRELLKNALRMRPNRLLIGECRGGEALDMLQAMNTGHDGSMTTLHANSPRDALARLETLALMAGLDLPARSIREQIAAAIDLIVFLERRRDGQRRIRQISEVVGMEESIISSHELFTRSLQDELQPTGLVPHFLQSSEATNDVATLFKC